jgi:uncharacterized protein YndB with AHSA1/START domain
MSPVTATVEIDRPADRVFAYATDPVTFHEWQKGVVSGHLDAAETPSMGSRCTTTRRIGFAARPITSEITELDPPRRWAIRSIDGPIRATVTVSVDVLEAGRSRLTIAIDFKGYGVGRALVPLFVIPEARREMPGNLAQLQHRLLATH